MKKVLVAAALSLTVLQGNIYAQKKCGIEELDKVLTAQYPDAAQRFAQIDEQVSRSVADYHQAGALAKTTATVYVPVVFHVVLTAQQLVQAGGPDGIRARAVSQLDVLNEDYNKANSDGSKIPAAFQPLYGNAEIRFAFAHTDPSGKTTEGIDFKTTTVAGFPTTSGSAGSGFACSDAKYNTDGLASWDHTRYLNIWVINFSDNNILGIAISPTYSSTFGIPAVEKGVCVNYTAFGRRTSVTQFFKSGIDRGRTLTHEVGHFFELRHIWGDDNGACPGSGGNDDGIADTPPQADKTYGAPTYPQYDACSNSATNGIMFMNYMDYTNDAFMYMFTKLQVDRMKAQVNGGPSVGLTQHPELFNYPAGVSQLEITNNFTVSPNPSNGLLQVTFNNTPGSLKDITITNIMGQKVYTSNTNDHNITHKIDLSGNSKGIYFIHCNFAEGTVTRKVVLQ